MRNFLSLAALVGCLFLTSSAWGQKIIDLRVEGNLKVETDAILALLTTAKGQNLDAESIRDDIVELYDLGYFSDIRVYKQGAPGGVTLTIKVKEKPSIMEIQFVGLEELSEDDFKEKLETKLYTIVNESTINRDLRIIEKQYLEQGFFLAAARYELESRDDKNHEVILKYIVDEGGKVLVGDVFINGNEYFTDAEILDKFVSKPVTRMSSFSAPGSVYNEDFLNRDVEIVSYIYKDQGFAEVAVSKQAVIMDADREFVRATLGVEEGIQYSVGGIEISGDVLYPKKDLKEWMKLKPGSLFRFSWLLKDMEMFTDKYGDKGYAFVDVNPIRRYDNDKALIYLNFQIEKGEKVYLGDIDIVGNTKTRDNVIRREFEVADAELYSGTGLSKSKRNVERLGFFEEVQAIKKRDADQKSLLNYKFKVKEKPTGQLQAAIGFSPGADSSSSQSKWFGQGRYNEENQSGLGWKSNITGKWNGGENYSLETSLTNPRVNDSRWSLGGSAFWKHQEQPITDSLSILERRVGGSVTVGKRLFEIVRGSITYGFTRIMQDDVRYLAERFRQDGVESSLIFALSRDDTNDYIDPSEGTKVRLSQRFTGGPILGGDRHLLESKASAAIFYPIDFTETYRTYFKLNTRIGVLAPYEDREISFYDRYKHGGPDDMRGFSYDSLGPDMYLLQSPMGRSDRVNNGGNKELLVQLEYFFPIIKEANIKGLVFTDLGRVYDNEERIGEGGFHRDVGFGIRWITPIAPFRFEWAYPIVDGRLGDQPQFNFSLGF